MRTILAWVLVGLTTIRTLGAGPGSPGLDVGALNTVHSLLGDMRDILQEEYRPSARFTPAFVARCGEADQALARAGSLNEAYGIIADALGALDPRIRFYPPTRNARVDYSWRWRIIGPAAFVTQVDREGDAQKQGLRLGDRVLSIEGVALDRASAEQVRYAMYTLAPRAGLRIQVQSPGEEPRWLAVASTVRPQRRLRSDGERTYTKEEKRRMEEFRDPRNHVRRVGQAAVWRADELVRDMGDVAEGLKLVRGASGLVLDLRGQHVTRHETVLRLLDGLFLDSFESGHIQKEGVDSRLRVSGGSQSFPGTLLVLVDAETSLYAEVLARIVQQRQRGVVMGDRTLGRVFDEVGFGAIRGRASNFTLGGVRFPRGEVVMADGVQLDGRGVTPDYQLLPTPADVAGRRDVLMAKALAMLKEAVAPEDAYQLFPHYADLDDDYDY